MKLKPVIVAIQILAIVTIAVFSILISPVAAAGNQSNQDINQPALLIAPDPDFQINVYPKPGKDKRRIGYGRGGDAVTVIEQVGSNEGYIWDYVKFDRSPALEGWIREDFVRIQEKVQETDRSHRFTSSQKDDRANQQPHAGERQNSEPGNGYSNQENQRQNPYNQRQNNQRQDNQRQY